MTYKRDNIILFLDILKIWLEKVLDSVLIITWFFIIIITWYRVKYSCKYVFVTYYVLRTTSARFVRVSDLSIWTNMGAFLYFLIFLLWGPHRQFLGASLTWAFGRIWAQPWRVSCRFEGAVSPYMMYMHICACTYMRVRMCVRVYMYILFPRLREHILHKRTHSIHHMSFVLREHILHKGTHHVHLFERGERLCQLLLFPPRLCLPDCLLVLGMQLLHERVARRLRAYSRQKTPHCPHSNSKN